MFPPDVVNLLIDYLRDNRKSLEACSLTARAWYPNSRRHLHTRFTFKDDEACRERLRHYADTHLASCVRTLIIVAPKLDRYSRYTSRSSHPRKFDLDVSFPNLEAIEWRGDREVEEDGEADAIKQYISTHVSATKITSLVLNDIIFSSIQVPSSLLELFPALRSIDFQRVHIPAAAEDTGPGVTKQAQNLTSQQFNDVSWAKLDYNLKYLHLDTNTLGSPGLIQWFLKEGAGLRVETLHLTYLVDPMDSIEEVISIEEADFATIVTRVKSSLKHLILENIPSGMRWSPARDILVQCDQLESLYLVMRSDYYESYDSDEEDILWLPRFMAALNYANFRQLTIKPRFTKPKALSEFGFSNVDDIIGQEEGLHQVLFLLSPSHRRTFAFEGIRKPLETAMPLVTARGILAFEYA